jgi:hypothetical protein
LEVWIFNPRTTSKFDKTVVVAELVTQVVERSSMVVLIAGDLAIFTLTLFKFFLDPFGMMQIIAERLGIDSDLVIQSVHTGFHLRIDNTGTKALLEGSDANLNFLFEILV